MIPLVIYVSSGMHFEVPFDDKFWNQEYSMWGSPVTEPKHIYSQ